MAKKKTKKQRLAKKQAVSVTLSPGTLNVLEGLSEYTELNRSALLELLVPSGDDIDRMLKSKLLLDNKGGMRSGPLMVAKLLAFLRFGLQFEDMEIVEKIFAKERRVIDVLSNLIPSRNIARAVEKYAEQAGCSDTPEEAIYTGFINNLADRMRWDREHPIGLQIASLTIDKSQSQKMDIISDLFCEFCNAKNQLAQLSISPDQQFKFQACFEQIELQGNVYNYVITYGPGVKKEACRARIVDPMLDVINALSGSAKKKVIAE